MKPRTSRSVSSHRPVPGKLRVYRVVGVVIALLLGALAVYGRCQQMDRARARAIESGMVALAHAIERGDGDYTEAEAAFHSAASEGFRDPYPRFCLSAIPELRGEQPVQEPAPEGWSTAVDLVAAGRLAEALQAFEPFRQLDPPYSNRAELYQRLIGELEPLLMRRSSATD